MDIVVVDAQIGALHSQVDDEDGEELKHGLELVSSGCLCVFHYDLLYYAVMLLKCVFCFSPSHVNGSIHSETNEPDTRNIITYWTGVLSGGLN